MTLEQARRAVVTKAGKFLTDQQKDLAAALVANGLTVEAALHEIFNSRR